MAASRVLELLQGFYLVQQKELGEQSNTEREMVSCSREGEARASRTEQQEPQNKSGRTRERDRGDLDDELHGVGATEL